MFTNDPINMEYRSRTDARLDVIKDSPWFNFPYPGLYSELYIKLDDNCISCGTKNNHVIARNFKSCAY